MTPACADTDRGVILVAAVLVVLLLSLTGLGLALTAATQPPTCRNVESAAAARLAARAAIVLVADDLCALADWSAVLQGRWYPRDLATPSRPGPFVVGLPAPTWTELTRLATCGRESGCSDTLRKTATADRPWGDNNPDWVWLGVLTVGPESPVPGDIPFEVGVWVGDDAEETDGDPWTDGGASVGGSPPSPGPGVVRIRAVAFGYRGEQAAMEAVVSRPVAGELTRLGGWRETVP